MNQWTKLPASNLEIITTLLQAASWCKTQEMELALAQAIKKHINPPILYNCDQSIETSNNLI